MLNAGDIPDGVVGIKHTGAVGGDGFYQSSELVVVVRGAGGPDGGDKKAGEQEGGEGAHLLAAVSDEGADGCDDSMGGR